MTLEEARKGKVFIGFQEIKCHLIFDIKTDGKFTLKARSVDGGHTTEPPVSLTYSIIYYIYSVRIALSLSDINNIDI